ncbi:MAG: PEP-CTERM sorting domain-containing protein [Verrucomicrobiaceae bacterium]
MTHGLNNVELAGQQQQKLSWDLQIMKNTLKATSILLGLSVGSASAVTTTLVDTFGDGNIATNTDGTVPAGVDGTYSTDINGTIVESGGAQTNTPADGNWARTELHHNNDYARPAAPGESLTFSWTIGNVNVTTDRTPSTDNDHDYRVQLNAISANRAQGGGSERWLVTEGAISLDLFFNESALSGSRSVQSSFFTKSDDQAGSSDGSNQGDLVFTQTQWDWNTTDNTISLEITDTGYTWSDSLGLINFTQTFAANADMDAIPAEFTNGIWAFHDGQNNDNGRGNHQLKEFTAVSVSVIPEPSAVLLSLLGVIGVSLRRRR